MADRLLIHYSVESEQPLSWVLVNEQGQPVSAIQQGTLDDAPPPAGYKTTLLMSSASIQLETVQIPTNNLNRQRLAAPFALEDRLASDIEDTHFALGKKLDNGLIPVATIDKQLLDTTLESFKQAGIKIDGLFADVLALPDESTNNGWSLLVTEQGGLVRSGPFSGYYCDRDNLPLVLSSLIKQAEPAPEFITLLHRDDDNL
ncbi:MAG: type II secretion system protein GspL, partial [Gammaproteobacteria bacterium]|nr:type II secretion system protein GspL [Gammaproteobacteria bacterium]